MNITTDQLLKGKYCVITSGAHGLGYTIARLFVSQGATVAICGLSPSGEESGNVLKKTSPESFFFQCDLSQKQQVDAFAEEVLRRFGRVDIVINNAGISKQQRLVDMDMETYERIQQVNIKSSIQLLKRFIPVMIDQKVSGTIVHVSSVNSEVPAPKCSAYAVSKGGVNALSKVIASELGKHGIRSNVVAPGWIATTYIKQNVDSCIEKGYAVEEELEKYYDTSPLMAPSRAEDIAGHVLFLASDLSSYLTGATIHADGGVIVQAHQCKFPEPENCYEKRIEYYGTVFQDLS